MKKVNQIAATVFFIILLHHRIGYAQFVVTDVTSNINQQAQISLQTKQLTESIELVYKMKESIIVAREGVAETKKVALFAKQTAEIMQAIADDKVSLQTINELKINDLKDLVEKVLCVDIDAFVPNDDPSIKILARFKSSIFNCNNYEYYNNTYAGIWKQIREKQFFSSFSDVREINHLSKEQVYEERRKLDEALIQAMEYDKFSSELDTRMMLEIGFKYLELSDRLHSNSKELYDNLMATTVDENGNEQANFSMSKAERQQLIMSCLDYQMKSFDYKLKGTALIREASSSKNGMAELMKIRAELTARAMTIDTWGK